MAEIRAGYPEIFKLCKETNACFVHTTDPRGTFDVTAEQRLAFWEELYAGQGFGIWQGNFRDMLTEPVHLLADVPEVLSRVGAERRLALITKGDLVHQTRKVTTSGIEHHFADIEIVLEKDPQIYAKILARIGVSPERFCMVGNSVRSDVLPVMALGGHAVHIPYHLTWELEHVDDHDEDVTELASIADLPTWLGLT